MRPHEHASIGLLAALAALVPAAPATAGGWTQPAGAHYAKVGVRSLLGLGGAARGYFADGEALELGEEYRLHQLDVYGEYGLTDDWTVVVHAAPVGWARAGDADTTWVGPVGAGVRRALLGDAVRLAVEGRAGWTPGLGDEVLASGLADGRPWAFRPVVPGATGEADLQVGYGLSWGWVTGSVGGLASSAAGVDPVVTARGSVGANLGTFLVDLALDLHEPVGDVTDTNVAGAGQTRYLGWNLQLGWRASARWGLSVGIGGAVYAESNAATAALSLAIDHRS